MSYLSPLLAVIVGIVHAGLAPVIVVGGVKPNLALVAVVAVTCLFGFVPGIVWAFAAGLTVNLLVGEPLGVVPLMLLLTAALTAAGARALGSFSFLFAVAAAFAGSLVVDAGSIFLGALLGARPSTALPLQIMLTAAALNAAIAVLALIPARVLLARYAPGEAPGW